MPETKQKLINTLTQLEIIRATRKANREIDKDLQTTQYKMEDLTRELLYQWVREEGIPFPEVGVAVDF